MSGNVRSVDFPPAGQIMLSHWDTKLICINTSQLYLKIILISVSDRMLFYPQLINESIKEYIMIGDVVTRYRR